MPKLLIISQEERRTAGLAEHYVGIAVSIDVRKGTAPAHDRLEQVGSRLLRRHRDKAWARLRARVPEQLRRLRVSLALLKFANLGFEVAVGRQQIQASVQVVIEEEDAKQSLQGIVLAGPFIAMGTTFDNGSCIHVINSLLTAEMKEDYSSDKVLRLEDASCTSSINDKVAHDLSRMSSRKILPTKKVLSR